MKDIFEKNIKEGLGNYEYEYNPKAWEALSSKLDAAPKGGKAPYKWYIAATVTAGLLVAGYFYFNSDNGITSTENTNEELVAEQNTPSAKTNTQDKQTSIHEEDKPTFTAQPDQGYSGQTNSQTTNIGNESFAPQNSVTSELGSNTTGNEIVNSQNSGTNGSENKDNKPNVSAPNKASEIHFNDPQIGSACQGLAMQIFNNNNFDLIIEFPNGQIWKGQANSSSKLLPSVAGIYHVGYYDNNNLVRANSFQVNKTPSASFEFIEADKPFENGLPTVKVVTESFGDEFNWSTEFENATGSSAEFHFFKDGKHNISLTVTGSNGCKSIVNNSVTIDNNYNLLAENVFVPTDLDPMNNVFMPDALVERNANFQMIIIDPRDGHVVFETNDSNVGWDGIDKKTGKLAAYQTAYIWKVTIMNPLPGEKPVYSGTITPLQNRH